MTKNATATADEAAVPATSNETNDNFFSRVFDRVLMWFFIIKGGLISIVKATVKSVRYVIVVVVIAGIAWLAIPMLMTNEIGDLPRSEGNIINLYNVDLQVEKTGLFNMWGPVQVSISGPSVDGYVIPSTGEFRIAISIDGFEDVLSGTTLATSDSWHEIESHKNVAYPILNFDNDFMSGTIDVKQRLMTVSVDYQARNMLVGPQIDGE